MLAKFFTKATIFLGLASGSLGFAQEPAPPEGTKRVVFLGDSITYAGDYVAMVETYLRLKNPGLKYEFINLGLPSETVSGLSEPGHAGGKFPRPDLNERLGRVLEKLKPDLVVACYGMNDGIYYPFGADRFRSYQDGMKNLRSKAQAAGAKVLHLTPTVFDPVPILPQTLPAGLPEYRQPYEGYDQVLERYSRWLLDQKTAGWDVVDIHGPMAKFLIENRKLNPKFQLANDGVHLNPLGHAIIAREILLHWGAKASDLPDARAVEKSIHLLHAGPEVFGLVHEKQVLLRDAWLSKTGHKRPGLAPGLPLPVASEKAGKLDERIGDLIKPAK